MAKIESTGGHIKIMLVIEITKIKLTGGQIEFMLIIEMAKIEINRRLYWIYANCTFVETAKIESTSGYIGFIELI